MVEEFRPVSRGDQGRAQGRLRAGVRHQHVDRIRRRSPLAARLVYEEVKIKAANRDLHSGIFGGGAQNPIRVLTRILGGIFDDDGHITIPASMMA